MAEIINGYQITGNHGTGAERIYHVCNAAGEALEVVPGSKRKAIARAEACPPGDVQPEPEPAAKQEPVVARKRKKRVVSG